MTNFHPPAYIKALGSKLLLDFSCLFGAKEFFLIVPQKLAWPPNRVQIFGKNSANGRKMAATKQKVRLSQQRPHFHWSAEVKNDVGAYGAFYLKFHARGNMDFLNRV